MFEWGVVYDPCLTRAALAKKVAYDNRKQKSYRLNRPYNKGCNHTQAMASASDYNFNNNIEKQEFCQASLA